MNLHELPYVIEIVKIWILRTEVGVGFTHQEKSDISPKNQAKLKRILKLLQELKNA